MRKFLLTLLIFIFANTANAETILLKCEYLDGKLERYKNNKFEKFEEINDPTKEYEIQLDTVAQVVSKGPYISLYGGPEVVWQNDWIIWQSDSNVVGPIDAWVIFSLNRVTGILTKNFKSLERVVEDGHYQKDSNGDWIRIMKWQSTEDYQCKKQERLF